MWCVPFSVSWFILIILNKLPSPEPRRNLKYAKDELLFSTRRKEGRSHLFVLGFVSLNNSLRVQNNSLTSGLKTSFCLK